MIGITITRILLSTTIIFWMSVDKVYGKEKAIAAGVIWKVKPYYWKDENNQSKGMLRESLKLYTILKIHFSKRDLNHKKKQKNARAKNSCV